MPDDLARYGSRTISYDGHATKKKRDRGNEQSTKSANDKDSYEWGTEATDSLHPRSPEIVS